MHKVLIANRGEIARRVMRACRQMGLATVAVFSEPDRRALFVAEADEAVPLGGSTPAESYLRVDRLLDAAARTKADAVHPGYGFLAENAPFAQACIDAGLTFIGPSPAAIAAMGSKIEAKRRMHAAGVPVLPSIELTDARMPTAAEVEKALGWPVLVKASAGGGGRGMRVARSASELTEAIQTARSEAQSAFGDAAVFLEPYVETSRHIEIQIFGDQQGQVVHLFERECSIQRRHQKILEEAPSPVVDDRLRAEMGAAAVAAGRAIEYTGAGTVEFLMRPDGRFFFLEMNTRLQVEHPVTEMITGLDLVRLQLLVAQGEALPPEAIQPRLSGHAIEVRLYAEDPRRGFMPVAGTLHTFELPADPGLRVETAVQSGSEVSPFYDPLLAKLIVHAPNRTEAARRLADILARARIHGPATNRELLVRLLRHPEFLLGQTDTAFLSRHKPETLGAPLGDRDVECIHAAAAALCAQALRRREAPVLASVPSGWRNNPSQLQQVRFTGATGEIEVGYRLDRSRATVVVDGLELPELRIDRCDPQVADLQIAGVRRTFRVNQVGSAHYVDSSLGSSELTELDRFPNVEAAAKPGSLVAPLPGIVAELRAAVGDQVAAGDVLLVIESMKMMHPVVTPASGTVREIRVAKASHVEAGTILAVVENATDTADT